MSDRLSRNYPALDRDFCNPGHVCKDHHPEAEAHLHLTSEIYNTKTRRLQFRFRPQTIAIQPRISIVDFTLHLPSIYLPIRGQSERSRQYLGSGEDIWGILQIWVQALRRS